MANATLFQSLGAWLRRPVTRNEAGGPAYQRPPKQALAQYASTGCLNATFYATDVAQLEATLRLAAQVTPAFLAQTAVYCRERGHMKDMPALLLAALSRRDPALMDRVFDRVVDSPRMLRTFVQIIRSGATGRKSLGSAPKRCVRRWLDQRTDAAIVAASVGTAPSLVDILRMVHPKPASRTREALYAYLTGREVSPTLLPSAVQQFEAFKAGDRAQLPEVPFQMLMGAGLTPAEWAVVARRGSWQMLRMNLNTFARHGVFDEPEMTAVIAGRLRDAAEIARARVFPYQLLAAFRAADERLPAEIRVALEDAMELALDNVPAVEGGVHVCPDVSGSMSSPITGFRNGATTAVRAIDAAALIAAAVLRRNPTATVMPFDTTVVDIEIAAGDRVLTNAQKLAAVGGGGTAVSAPLKQLNARRASGDLVIIVSDNESWLDARSSRGTETLREWDIYRSRNPRAGLALIDLQPYATTQAMDRADILNIGGFSDRVFGVVADFATGRLQSDHWVGEIENVTI